MLTACREYSATSASMWLLRRCGGLPAPLLHSLTCQRDIGTEYKFELCAVSAGSAAIPYARLTRSHQDAQLNAERGKMPARSRRRRGNIEVRRVVQRDDAGDRKRAYEMERQMSSSTNSTTIALRPVANSFSLRRSARCQTASSSLC